MRPVTAGRRALAGLLAAAIAALLLLGLHLQQLRNKAPLPARAAVTAQANVIAAAPGWIDVQGGTRVLSARADGVVASVSASGSATVAAGTVLLQLDDQDLQLEQQAQALEIRRQQQAADDLAAQRREAREEVARLRALVRIQAEPADTLRQAQAQLRSLDSTAVQTRLQRASARIRQQSLGLQRRQLQVLAPTRGRVLRLDVHEAEAVMRGTPVAWFAPDAPLIVRAELDERLFTRVRVGMPAQVESESGSGRRFGARLTSIAPHVGPVRALPEVRTAASDDHVVECVFALDTGGLLIGQRVIVRVLGTP